MEAPIFNPGEGSYEQVIAVTIATPTPGALIRYTTDGSAPTSTYGKEYQGTPVSVTGTTTVKAIAYLDKWSDSTVTTTVYSFSGTAAKPVLTPGGGTYATPQSISMSTATPGAAILYTLDGSTPSAAYGTVYLGVPVSVPATGTVLAIAVKPGLAPSEVAMATYVVSASSAAVDAPAFSPAAGSYAAAQMVSLVTATPGARIRYTLDGTAPAYAYGIEYGGVPLTVSRTVTITAAAFLADGTTSAVSAATYAITGSVDPPSFSPAGGTYTAAQYVALSTATPGAAIRYTTDGSAPAQGWGTEYLGVPVPVDRTMVLKAVAVLSDLAVSTVSSASYTVAGTVSAPYFTPGAGTYAAAQSVIIGSDTAGASIRYTTDGSDPTASTGTVFSAAAPVAVSQTVTLRAMAYKTGLLSSAVVGAAYSISPAPVAAPAFSPAAGSYAAAQTVILGSTTPGARIRYTLDGTDPTASYGTEYGGVPVTVAQTTTVKAVAFLSDGSVSPVSAAVFSIAGTVDPPSFSPAGGTYTAAQYVALSTATAGAVIRYTADGTDPTADYGTQYLGVPVTVARTFVLKAVAAAPGRPVSSISSASYTIVATAATPYFTPAAGTYAEAQSVAIATTTDGAAIRYTTDGSYPSPTSGTVYSPAAPVEVIRSMTLRAIAYKADMLSSAVGSAAYVIAGTVASPVSTPAAGTYAEGQSVSIATTTDGATIVYTTDGTAPAVTGGGTVTNGIVYTGPVPVVSTASLRAIAFKTGWTNSAVVTSAYSIAVDATGTVGQWNSLATSGTDVRVLYYDTTNANLKLALSADGGPTWSFVTVDYPNTMGQYASLLPSGSDPDVLYASYYDGTNLDLRFARSADGGATWTRSSIDFVTGTTGQYTSIAAPTGALVISYYDATGLDLELARSTDDGATWTVLATQDAAGTVGQYTSAAAEGAVVLVAYYDATNTNLKVARSADSGAAWAVSAPVVNDAGNVGLYPSVRFETGTANAWISYYDATNGDLKILKSADAGASWTGPATVDSAGTVGLWTSLAVSGSTVAVGYEDESNYALKVALSTDGGISWTLRTVDTGGVGQYVSLAIAGPDLLYAAYYDFVNLDLKVARSADGGASWTRY